MMMSKREHNYVARTRAIRCIRYPYDIQQLKVTYQIKIKNKGKDQ